MKKFAIIIAACFAFGFVTSGTTYAAQKDVEKQEKLHQQKLQEKKQQKVLTVEDQNKGQLRQLESIDKQLDNIEKKISYYQSKLPLLSAPLTSNDSSKIEVTNTATTSSEDSTKIETEEDVDDVLKQYPGYKGKFNALKNRLKAVSNQLNSLKSKTGSDELTARYKRIEDLNTRVNTAFDTLEKVQIDVKKLFQKESAKKLDDVNNVEQSKEWKIKFSKTLNEQSFSNLDIIVLDAEQNLVETTITYSDKTKSIVITPIQAYESGNTYTLFIGKDISADNGSTLSNSIKMNFTVK